MKVLTELFERDCEIKLIDCSAKLRNRTRMRRTVVVIAKVESSYKQTVKDELGYVGFKTDLVLFRSKEEYLLQVAGISSRPKDFTPRYKVVDFKTPGECLQIVDDEEDSRLYMSPLLLELLEKAQDSPYLTDFEREKWEECLIDSE